MEDLACRSNDCRCSTAKATAIEAARLLHDELLSNRWLNLRGGSLLAPMHAVRALSYRWRLARWHVQHFGNECAGKASQPGGDHTRGRGPLGLFEGDGIGRPVSIVTKSSWVAARSALDSPLRYRTVDFRLSTSALSGPAGWRFRGPTNIGRWHSLQKYRPRTFESCPHLAGRPPCTLQRIPYVDANILEPDAKLDEYREAHDDPPTIAGATGSAIWRDGLERASTSKLEDRFASPISMIK